MVAISEEQPLADVIRRVADEIRRLHSEADNMDRVIGELIRSSSNTPAEHYQQLQYNDILFQSLGCLVLFLEMTASKIHPDWLFDPGPAAANLTLHNLANRLAGPANDIDSSTELNAGDCSFF